MQERLQKIIAAAGVASRRAAEQLIVDGRVRVNGAVVTELGMKADPSRDHIKVDGKLINPKQPPTYLMLHKPSGFVTTMSDPEGRPTVQDLLKGVRTRVFPVGRLDYNTEGLLLLTNDGDFAHLITHPRHEFPKTYLAKVKGVLSDDQIRTLEQGMFLDDGKTAPARVRKVRKEEANSWLEITIHEGRKRQVRRMFDHVGSSVIRLKRTKTGPLLLGDLPRGQHRHLTGEEVRALRESALSPSEKAAAAPRPRPVRAPKKAGLSAGDGRTKHGRPAGIQPKSRPLRDGERRPRRFSGAMVMQETSQGLRRNQAPGSRTRPEPRPDQANAGTAGRRPAWTSGHAGRPGTGAGGDFRKAQPGKSRQYRTAKPESGGRFRTGSQTVEQKRSRADTRRGGPGIKRSRNRGGS